MASLFDDATVVVTGASSGIGEAMAQLIAPRVKRLVLVARRKERLDKLAERLKSAADLAVDVWPCDLSNSEATRDLAEKLRDLAPDVLINNAGIGDMGMFDLANIDKQLSMLDLNCKSVLQLTHAVLPKMIERGRGGILNVSSAFGMTYMPGFAGYLGTKHFVTGFTEGLRADCARTGVHITQLCPGPVATEFEQNIGNFTGQQPPGFIEISAERCARAGIRGVERDRAMVIPGLLMTFVVWVRRMSPEPIVRLFARLFAPMVRKRQQLAQQTGDA